MHGNGLSKSHKNGLFSQPEPQLSFQEANNILGFTWPALILSDINPFAPLAGCFRICGRKKLLNTRYFLVLCTVALDFGYTKQTLVDTSDSQRFWLEHGRLVRPALGRHQAQITNLILIRFDDRETPSRTLTNGFHD